MISSDDDFRIVQLRCHAGTIDWLAGDTKHVQTYNVFLRAASLGVQTDDALSIAREFILANGGELRPRDLRHQCGRAYAYVNGKNPAEIDTSCFIRDEYGNLVPKSRQGAKFNRATLASHAAKFLGLVTTEYLKARSSSWPGTWHPVLRGLFEKQVVLIYDDMEKRRPINARLTPPYPATLSGPKGIWFLSNPVDGRSHPNGEGNPSWRCEAAITHFRHLVLECDHEGPGIAEDWLRFLVLLPMPIRAIYTSGGKSVHALVAINATSKADWDARVMPLKGRLIECGACPGAMTAVRLTRLPYCFREEKGRWQELLYYRPDADGTPIAQLEAFK